ncbi:MAG: SAM-dependent methyltransferase, partial [Actinomycetia bacterium]|nr:SAM-dependent methyltransferase [Actinomycetes bacterium]
MAERGQDGNAQPDWNGALGVSWVAHADAIDTLWEPFGKRTIDALAPRPGDSVLDIGCGAGATTIEIARRVAPRGRSLGVDLSGPLLELAARRAKTAQVSNATFEQADAAT